jgi:rod shape-determining protein MreD
MRWLTFLTCAAVGFTVQSALAPRFELFGIRPDWLLVVVVFFALYARPSEAVIGAWVLGIGADLMTVERLGFLALSYALAALFVIAIREYLFCHRPATQFAVTFLASLLIRLVWFGYRHLLYDPVGSIVWDFIGQVVLVSMYTAVWAPLIDKPLWSMARLFGIPRPRYTHAGLDRTVGAGV